MPQRDARSRRVFKNVSNADGSIMATIIVSHIRRNIAVEIAQDCPGIRIHIMDIVQPPGMCIPPPIVRQ